MYTSDIQIAVSYDDDGPVVTIKNGTDRTLTFTIVVPLSAEPGGDAPRLYGVGVPGNAAKTITPTYVLSTES